jgi:hypothetical protein
MATDKEINNFLDVYDPEVQAIAHELCRIVSDTAPDLKEEVKRGWKNITYSGKGVVCAVQPYSQYVSLHFYKGTELDDPNGVLQGGGKQLRHVKIPSLDAIDERVLAPLIKQALAMDKS